MCALELGFRFQQPQSHSSIGSDPIRSDPNGWSPRVWSIRLHEETRNNNQRGIGAHNPGVCAARILAQLADPFCSHLMATRGFKLVNQEEVIRIWEPNVVLLFRSVRAPHQIGEP